MNYVGSVEIYATGNMFIQILILSLWNGPVLWNTYIRFCSFASNYCLIVWKTIDEKQWKTIKSADRQIPHWHQCKILVIMILVITLMNGQYNCWNITSLFPMDGNKFSVDVLSLWKLLVTVLFRLDQGFPTGSPLPLFLWLAMRSRKLVYFFK